MRRAVQQESRSLSSSSKKKKSQGRCCLLFIMLSPVVVVLMILYVMSMYNAMVHYDEQQQKLLRLAEHEEENAKREQQLLRKRQADVARLAAVGGGTADRDEKLVVLDGALATLVLTTSFGPIRIQMRPDLSEGSVDYIHRLVESKAGCKRCSFYRAEKPGILQGIMAAANKQEVPTNEQLGSCPPGDKEVIKNECPKHDPNCGCHGPLMTRGSVAWAAGQAGGPDFFIDAYKGPATWWGTQHTNFGFVDDPASMAIVDQILNLPVAEMGGLHYLKDTIPFTMALE